MYFICACANSSHITVGKEKLKKYTEMMCKDAGLYKKTNHSLRATGASFLFNEGVPFH